MCCSQACDECIDNGTLSGGTISVNPNPPCPDDDITFTVSGVTDSGGQKREDCVVVDIPAVAPMFSWTLTLPAGYPPPLPPTSGTGNSVTVKAKAPGIYSVTFTAAAERECRPPDIIIGPETVEVPDVDSVKWETISGNLPLDTCTANGGRRIFPGKNGPDDPNPAQRRTVRLKATLKPAVEGCTVHFRTWDVDDPFDQNNPTRPDVQEIDADADGPDNRPNPEAVWADSGDTDVGGEAAVIFTVSMQPGNNYRAGASGFLEAIDSATQADADANTPPDHVLFAEMLTVWRRVHVELDSMAAVTGNEIDGPFTDIVGTGTALTQVTGTGLLDDGSPDLDDSPAGNGRFENGTLIIGTPPNTITISPVTGNGDSRVVFPEASIAGLPFRAGDGSLVDPSIIEGTIVEVGKFDNSFVWTLNVTASTDDPIDWSKFSGGIMSVGGGDAVDITDANGAAQQLTTSALSIPCIVRDDDDNSLLPRFPDVSALAPAYEQAYVLPLLDVVGDANVNVPFVLNVQGAQGAVAAMDWDSRSQNAEDFWVAYVLTAFQAETFTIDASTGNELGDSDPNSELATAGIAPGTGGALVFLEVHQTHEGIPNPIVEEQNTVVHETGHAVGDSAEEPVTGNDNQDLTFTSRYLDRIRTSPKPRS